MPVKPWETYRANLSIDLGKHHVPKTFLDKVAFITVKILRIPTDIFFQPKWYERLLVLTVQGVFFNAFFVLYLLSPKLAHRIVGYLEEEAIHSYTEYLRDIDDGKIENVPAPVIAIDYWRLLKDATLKDVITVIRADEAHHRDVNHFASDIHYEGKKLREAPAPLGYH
ncbi:hypothetical protein LOK49_LG12G01050 [Camellia lanceoleosa]|uniref:Uncharacterized protein n=1 Tax=Camellia lanceoleosa TaxID=1840588 RepID=A0ACC0FRT0_9ERIC|nr:hypothetical protein LOK49_LG12G01050 [Camellia lanceoleosa]